jgi:phage tail-like protein
MSRHDPLRSHRFRVEIDNTARAGFSEVSGLESQIAVVDYREGTDPPHVRRLPGLTKFSNITLKYGITTDGDALALFKWFRDVSSGALANNRRRVAIIVQDETGQDKARFIVTDAWPVKYAASDLNAKGNEVMIEVLELANEGIERVE